MIFLRLSAIELENNRLELELENSRLTHLGEMPGVDGQFARVGGFHLVYV